MVALSDARASGRGPDAGGVVASSAQRLPLPALLALATRVVTEDVHRGLVAEGFADIRPAHGYAFSLIAMGGGATGVEIAAHLGITKQSAKVLVDQLETAGYVTRERIDRDRRARLVQLTGRAWACIEVGTRLWAEAEANLRAAVGEEALDSTRRVLEQLVGTHIGRDEAIPCAHPADPRSDCPGTAQIQTVRST